MTDSQAAYDELIGLLKQTALLGSCASLLGWDEQTYLPPQGGELRANQMALLAGMVHDQATAPRVGELLSHLADAPRRHSRFAASRQHPRSTAQL